MKPPDGEAAGQRIARARRRRGLSQTVLAGLVGRSESWLSQVERGKRGIDSHSVLTRLAEILRVDVVDITGPEGGTGSSPRAYPAAPLIEQAMMGYGAPGNTASEEPGQHASARHLRARARSAYQAYQATRYDATGRLLPGLIRDVETASRIAGAASRAACEVRAHVYDTAAALLNRVGEPFLAWAAADRAMSAAAALRIAFPRYSVNILPRRGGRPRYEVVSRDGSNLYCLISDDAREIWRELRQARS